MKNSVWAKCDDAFVDIEDAADVYHDCAGEGYLYFYAKRYAGFHCPAKCF
jgi:hypothetical protein